MVITMECSVTVIAHAVPGQWVVYKQQLGSVGNESWGGQVIMLATVHHSQSTPVYWDRKREKKVLLLARNPETATCLRYAMWSLSRIEAMRRLTGKTWFTHRSLHSAALHHHSGHTAWMVVQCSKVCSGGIFVIQLVIRTRAGIIDSGTQVYTMLWHWAALVSVTVATLSRPILFTCTYADR